MKWKFKLVLQLILAHIPFGERVNYLFQTMHGSHENKNIKKRVMSFAVQLAKMNRLFAIKGKTVVEIGTGWEPISLILLYILGAGRVVSIDHVPHLRWRLVERTLGCVVAIREELLPVLGIELSEFDQKLEQLLKVDNLRGFLEAASVDYIAPGDARNVECGDGEVDLIFSKDVLEHIPEKQIEEIIKESFRVLRSGGHAFHAIGLHDHYANFDSSISRVNFVKYPEWIWRAVAKNKISYHNRLREREFITLFEEIGFKVLDVENRTDPRNSEALKKMKVSKRFQDLTLEEIAVDYSTIIIEK